MNPCSYSGMFHTVFLSGAKKLTVINALQTIFKTNGQRYLNTPIQHVIIVIYSRKREQSTCLGSSRTRYAKPQHKTLIFRLVFGPRAFIRVLTGNTGGASRNGV